jgi:hypothetical protein
LAGGLVTFLLGRRYIAWKSARNESGLGIILATVLVFGLEAQNITVKTNVS